MSTVSGRAFVGSIESLPGRLDGGVLTAWLVLCVKIHNGASRGDIEHFWKRLPCHKYEYE